MTLPRLGTHLPASFHLVDGMGSILTLGDRPNTARITHLANAISCQECGRTETKTRHMIHVFLMLSVFTVRERRKTHELGIYVTRKTEN